MVELRVSTQRTCITVLYIHRKPFNFSVSTTTTWAENSNRIVNRSQAERGKTAQMRSDVDNLINMVSSQVWDMWSNTNNALARRAAEQLESKSKLQMHLHKVNL